MLRSLQHLCCITILRSLRYRDLQMLLESLSHSVSEPLRHCCRAFQTVMLSPFHVSCKIIHKLYSPSHLVAESLKLESLLTRCRAFETLLNYIVAGPFNALLQSLSTGCVRNLQRVVAEPYCVFLQSLIIIF